MDYETLLFDLRDGVATITLNRPDGANAINNELSRDLMDAALRCDEDGAVRAVVVTGAGRFFCGGGDLREFHSRGAELPAHIKETVTFLHAGISRLRRMAAPVVAAVNGPAAGAGMSLAIACDVTLAAASASFMMAYTRVGLTPDGSATYFLPRIVGTKRALELALTNRSLSAEEAVAWGLATRVVDDAKLLDEAQALAMRLADGPKEAFGVTKGLIEGSLSESLETQMELEGRAIAAASGRAEAREGIAAFLEKRVPAYRP